MKYESFSYTPVEMSESMTGTVHDTLTYLYNNDYLKETDYNHLMNTLAVYAMPNRKGFGARMRERFFGKDADESAFVFPIIEIDASYSNNPSSPKGKPRLNVVEGKFNKDEQND